LTLGAVCPVGGESFSIPFPALFLRSVGDDILTSYNVAVQFDVVLKCFLLRYVVQCKQCDSEVSQSPLYISRD
jgi:hypothetical protein